MPGRHATRILVVDEDQMLCKLVQYVLSDEGYDVAVTNSASNAAQFMARDPVQLLLLEVRLSGIGGLEFCRQLRSQQLAVPVLFLSAASTLDDVVAGFDAGADDYLGKPFDPRELLVRVRALLSRQYWGGPSSASHCLAVGGYSLDLVDLSMHLPGGGVVQLTPQEVRVLQCLMVNAGRVVTRDAILQAAWGPDYHSESNQVDVYIRRIRRKIEQDPENPIIATVYGLGYRLSTGEEPGEPQRRTFAAV